MILYIVLAIVLWFVVPLFVDGHVKNKNDRKAWRLLSRIIAVLIFVFTSVPFKRDDIYLIYL